MDLFKQIKWNTVLVSGVVALLGLIILGNPSAAALSVCSLVGWFLAIGGALTLFAYFAADKSRFVLAMALLQLLPGVYIIVRPDILVSFVSVLLGLVLLAYGLACLRESRENRLLGYRHWWFNLIVGIVTTLLALLIIINPFEAGSTVMILAGASMLAHGVLNIVSVIVISNDIKKML